MPKILFTAFDRQKIFKGTRLNGLNRIVSLAGLFVDFSGFCLISLICLSCIMAFGLFSFGLTALAALRLIVFVSLGVSFIGGFVGFVGLGFVSLAILINDISLIGPSGISGHVGFIGPGLVGIVNHKGLIGQISLVGQILAGLIGNISLAGLIGGISFIGGFIGFLGLGLVSLPGLNSRISLVGLGCLSDWFACSRKKMWWWIASFGFSNHIDVFKYRLDTAILAAAAETIPPWCIQAAHGVAMMSSATKIRNAAIHFIAQRSFVREGELNVACIFF
jgi:hypothetical protein